MKESTIIFSLKSLSINLDSLSVNNKADVKIILWNLSWIIYQYDELLYWWNKSTKVFLAFCWVYNEKKEREKEKKNEEKKFG
jgi:hypothetical protein